MCQFYACSNVVSFSCPVSTTKRQQTMISFLSSNERSQRVAGKLYKNFRGKQNKGYILAMKSSQSPEITALTALQLLAV